MQNRSFISVQRGEAIAEIERLKETGAYYRFDTRKDIVFPYLILGDDGRNADKNDDIRCLIALLFSKKCDRYMLGVPVIRIMEKKVQKQKKGLR